MNAFGEQKRADETAAEFSADQAMLHWVQALAPYGIFATDRELRIRSWNRWLCEHTKLGPAEVIGRSLGDCFPEIVARRLIGHYERALSGEASLLSTALHRHLLPVQLDSGKEGPALMLQTVRIAPLRDERGIVGTITLLEDVTLRESQSRKLLQQQGMDRLLSEALAALLQSTDPARDVPEILLSMTPSLGVDASFHYVIEPGDKHLRLSWGSGVSPQQKEALARIPVLDDLTDLAQEPERVFSATIEAHRAALRSIGLQQQFFRPLAIGERVLGLLVFGSYHDRPVGDDNQLLLARIARYAAIALDRAQREREMRAALRARDDFLAALSHELRAPLNPVLLVASDAAANEDYPPAVREAFSVIERNAQLEARLIDDLLDLTRIEHGKVALELHRLDLHRALREACFTVHQDVAARGIEMQFDLQAERTTVIGDEVRLQQVFWNVLKNAVKFTDDGGRVSISSRSDEGTITIEIADSGLGMEPHELERLFTAFSQGDHAQPGGAHRFGGLGLGLAISRKLVQLHAGRIEAFSEGRMRGSTFRISLPLETASEARAPEPPRDLRRRGARGNLAVGGRPVRLLVVEDHESTRITLQRLLTRRGCEVVAVASSEAALRAAADTAFDLVVSDIGLPGIDGYELMRTLRDQHGLSGIALSGYGMEEDVARSRAAGFIAHLTKPVRLEALNNALSNSLAGTE